MPKGGRVHPLRQGMFVAARSKGFFEDSLRKEVLHGVRVHPLRQAMFGAARSKVFFEDPLRGARRFSVG